MENKMPSKLKTYLDEAAKPSLAQFKKLVDAHDLTYVYSDHGTAYAKGTEEHRDISRMFNQISDDSNHDAKVRKQMIKIWNDNVDKKITEQSGSRKDFYWDFDDVKKF